MLVDPVAVDAPAEEIGPQELGERRSVLGETADAAQLAGQRTIGIVNQRFDRVRIGEMLLLALFVEGCINRRLSSTNQNEPGSRRLRLSTTVVATCVTPSSCSARARW